MSHNNTRVERRRHPRVKERLQLKLKAEDFDAVTETINLSSIGAYCPLNKCIPLMTSLKIALVLPHGDQGTEFEYAECSGVVVRVDEVPCQDNKGSVYNTAIYFDGLEEIEREKIATFLHRRRRAEKGIAE